MKLYESITMRIPICCENALLAKTPAAMRTCQNVRRQYELVNPSNKNAMRKSSGKNANSLFLFGDKANLSNCLATMRIGKTIRRQCELVNASKENAKWSSPPATMRIGHACRQQCELVKPSTGNVNWSSHRATM